MTPKEFVEGLKSGRMNQIGVEVNGDVVLIGDAIPSWGLHMGGVKINGNLHVHTSIGCICDLEYATINGNLDTMGLGRDCSLVLKGAKVGGVVICNNPAIALQCHLLGFMVCMETAVIRDLLNRFAKIEVAVEKLREEVENIDGKAVMT